MAAAGRRLLLHDIDWRTYRRLLRIFAGRRGIRLSYDRGLLEIRRPLFEHEIDATLLDRFVVALTEELGLPIEAGGSTTLQRRRRRRGLEPDRCWWIAHAPQLQGRRRLDLRVDPPPDLALEVDVTHSSVDRMGIYAALRVPEVWRFDGQDLTFHHLGPDGRYAVHPHSLAFPWLTSADLLRFLPLRATLDQNGVVAQFRAWVRQHFVAGRSSQLPVP